MKLLKRIYLDIAAFIAFLLHMCGFSAPSIYYDEELEKAKGIFREPRK
jgi:hypothetical protein